jgi:hypothetical protein
MFYKVFLRALTLFGEGRLLYAMTWQNTRIYMGGYA